LALGACGGGSSGRPDPVINTTLGETWSLEAASPGSVSLNSADVDAVLDHVFTDAAVQSAMLLKRGYVVGERHAAGFSRDDLGTSWSVAKSIYGAAIGVAIDEGWITDLDQPASDFIDEWLGTDNEAITIGDILEMRAGFANEPIFSEIDQTDFAVSRVRITEPGESFVYSNNTSQLMEILLQRATGLDAHSYVTEKILGPIGIDVTQIGLWFDPTGVNPMTYCCIDMHIDDFARFGLLFARGGEWDGEQIVSSSYVTWSLAARSDFYGLQWWVLNDAYFADAVPITMSAALGLDGQKIYVWPQADVVLAVLTQYEHASNQGYVLSGVNFPQTCTARNSCADSEGDPVPTFNERRLIDLLAELN
jgi:CubicO group peptidase (beta-lactamase class C family)